MIYNLRVKVFPDGTKQYLYSEKAKMREFERVLEELPDAYLDSETEEGKNSRNVSEECGKRACQRIWDIARANVWDYFFTLTLDPACVDRFNYSDVTECIKSFTKSLAYYGCEWLIVPEQHKSGAWHFHGLLKGNPPVKIAKVIKDGTVLYNFENFRFGFTSLSKVKEQKRVSTYISKYLTKEMLVPKGKKRYWFSRSLNQPQFVYCETTHENIIKIMTNADFRKKLTSPFGDYWMLEVSENGF